MSKKLDSLEIKEDSEEPEKLEDSSDAKEKANDDSAVTQSKPDGKGSNLFELISMFTCTFYLCHHYLHHFWSFYPRYGMLILASRYSRNFCTVQWFAFRQTMLHLPCMSALELIQLLPCAICTQISEI